MARQRLQDLEVRHGLSRGVGVEGDPFRVAPAAADRRPDPSPPRARAAANERQEPADELPTPEQALPAPGAPLRPGDDQDPGTTRAGRGEDPGNLPLHP